MSLINDALKKAQKQRTGESAPRDGSPGVATDRPAGPGQRRSTGASNVPILQIALGGGAVLLFVVGCVFLVQFLINRPVAPTPPKPAAIVEAAPKPAETAPKPVPAETTPAKPAQDVREPGRRRRRRLGARRVRRLLVAAWALAVRLHRRGLA